jgi:hypothetical protein
MTFRASPTLPLSLHWQIFILIFKYEGCLSTFRNLRDYLISTPRRSSDNIRDRSDADIRRSNIPTNILIMTWHQRKKILQTNETLMRNNWLKIWYGSILDKHPFLHGCGLRAYPVTAHRPDIHRTQAKLKLGISEVCGIHRSNRGICWGSCGNGQMHRSLFLPWNDGCAVSGKAIHPAKTETDPEDPSQS